MISAATELGFPPTNDLNGKTMTGFTLAQAMNGYVYRTIYNLYANSIFVSIMISAYVGHFTNAKCNKYTF